MIKAGIIGLGKMGISHCSIINAHPDVELVAVCEISKLVKSAIEKYSGIKCFKDYKNMIDQCKLDCLVVSTPTSSHAEIACHAMKRNIHVFVEKPLSLIPDEGHKMVYLAKRQNLVNQVGYHHRFICVFQEVKRLIENRAIGDIYHITGEAYGPVVLREKGSTWRSNKSEGGGCLYDYAAHVIDLVNYLVGPPDRVRGAILKKIYSRNVDDAVYATFLYNSGLSGQVSVNWSDETYRKMSTQIILMGYKGKIIADRQECKIYLLNKEGFDDMTQGWNMRYITDFTKPVDFYLRGEEYSAQIDYFIKCIKENNTKNLNSFESALQTDIVIDLLKNDAEKRS